ncbi:hypothetical protein SCHPADRAFT_119592 [Schizopora paradoxa]|uniref:Uncharacterized protein n=1 Tax=Schizopora paradoxa TaxID=27342 RepID=A0A0H2S2E4_9AGAM|nr:hypothetical protein SCHPADRAFT_119592 [Schizopora paradoxa]
MIFSLSGFLLRFFSHREITFFPHSIFSSSSILPPFKPLNKKPPKAPPLLRHVMSEVDFETHRNALASAPYTFAFRGSLRFCPLELQSRCGARTDGVILACIEQLYNFRYLVITLSIFETPHLVLFLFLLLPFTIYRMNTLLLSYSMTSSTIQDIRICNIFPNARLYTMHKFAVCELARLPRCSIHKFYLCPDLVGALKVNSESDRHHLHSSTIYSSLL